MEAPKTDPGKLKAIHTLFSKHKITDKEDKQNIVKSITGGRTSSTRELTDSEANGLLTHLQSLNGTADRRKKMQNKILRLAHEMGWKKVGSTKIDMARVNKWCVKSGYLHKILNKYTYEELPKLVSQFEKVHADYISKL